MMNDVFDPRSENQMQRWLDRLVDGELAPDQQRQLLLSLDAQPDGWRRCALAFLESQIFCREFGVLLKHDLPAQTQTTGESTAVVAISKSFDNRKSQWLSRMAIAAGLLLAFTLGMALRGTSAGGSTSKTVLAGGDTADVKNAITNQTANRELLQVTLPAADGQPAETIEVPLIEGDETALASLLEEQTPVLSDLERKTLESTGHRVEQVRAYYPVQLEDGRQAVLPMDLVEVEYTGSWQ